MAEKIDLYEAIINFINKKCSIVNNKDFIINYHHPDNSNKDNLQILYDDNNSIKCFLNKKDDLNKNEKDLKLLIKESSFELVIYKNDTDLTKIKCIILLIVNDYSIIQKEEPNKFEEETFMDINNDEEIIDKLKIFLFNYIKEKNNKNKELSVDNILLNNSVNNIRFFNNKEIKNFDKTCESNIQINIKYNIKYILDELNPKFKENLMDKYLDEMPEEIVNLMKKYKKVTFNNDMYMNYLNNKKNQENDNKSESKEKDQKDNENEKDNEKENKEENKDMMSPVKKEKKEKKKKDEKNGNLSSDKKQLFKIK